MRQMVSALIVVGLLFLPSTASAAGRCGSHPWCDTSRPPGERAGLLLRALTLDEKLLLMAGDDPAGVVSGNPATGTSDGVPRLDLPTVYYSDGPVGPREGNATAMPGPLALASTFSAGLALQAGATIGDEVKHKGNDIVHAPTVDIMRTPLAGRTFETYGEDPLLASRLGVAWIRGAQAQGVVGNVKHYAPNSQEGQLGAPPLGSLVGSRFTVDAIIDERTLREIYLPAFEAAVKQGGVGSVMCAYNRLNGSPACQDRHLLQEILRDEWGFDGFVLSDYFGATKSTAASAENGLALDMPVGIFYTRNLLHAAILSGRLSPATVDLRVGDILRTMFRFGLFDRAAYPSDDRLIDRRAHAGVAREIEQRGTVLLKNRGALPLDASRLRSLAIIGADSEANIRGGGSSAVRPFAFQSPRAAITRRAGSGVKVRFDPGEDPDSAADTARGADAAIVFAADHSTEGADKPCLSVRCAAPDPAGGEPSGTAGRPDYDAVIEAVAAANPRTIVVLETGGPVLTPWTRDVEGLVEAWYPGQEGGPAIAGVLFGDVNPSGRLPVSFPVREGDIPTAGNRLQYPGVAERTVFSEGVFVGYRHYDERGIEPRFPFGHGLSYTRFRYGGLRVVNAAGGGLKVSVQVRNVGNRAGVEVPQLYLGLPDAPGIAQPPRALKGFANVSLRRGRRKRVRFRLSRRDLSHWANGWRVAPGCYRVEVGASSRDVRQVGVASRGGAICPVPKTCLSRRSPIGPRNIGRIRLRRTRARLRALPVPTRRRTPRSYRYCVTRSRGRVVAVFAGRRRSARVRLVTSTAPRHRLRRIGRGVSTRRLARRFPARVRVARGLWRASPGSRRVFGTRRGRVRFVAVADRRLLRNERRLRAYLRRAGL